jgi:tripartite-type tricarboxylate transporter receptor subunit TctC
VVATSFVINASVYSKLPYDSLRDFAPITSVSLSPLVLVANPSLPVRSVSELIALAKANPGKLNYSTTGIGGGVHLSIEMLRELAGIDIVHVPYKGTVAAVTDVISGVVQFTVTGLPVAMPMVSAGKLRALAIAGDERSPAIPELPTIKESLPGYVYNNWIGILAPANTPKDVLATLHESVVKVMQSEDLKQAMRAQGDVPMTMSSSEFSDLIRTELARYQKLVKSIGVSID